MMTQKFPPLPYHPSFETVFEDEAETQQGLSEAMLSIARRTYDDTGYAHRAVHAKAHGYILAKFEVLPNLPPPYAQGLFAEPAAYDAIIRFSTTPGDVLHDNISTPRGLALKVLDVRGGRLPGSEGETTQNYVFGNSPSFQVATAKSFLKQLKPLAATTGHGTPLKHVASVLTRTAEAGLEKIGLKSATLTMLAGQAPTELLGDTYFSQAALLHGAYFGKVAISPVSSEMVALSQRPIDVTSDPDAIRASVREFFRRGSAVWEMRVQLATSIETMPIEDATANWPESESPYVAVARITAASQDSWSDTAREAIEDRMAFNPWTGLAAHRPLGSIMRARKLAYKAARDYRSDHNEVEIGEPMDLRDIKS